MNRDLIEEGVLTLLKGLGCDLGDPNLAETPSRVSRMYEEIFAGLSQTENQVKDILLASFPCPHDQLIVAKDVIHFGVCPHHLLPVRYRSSVAYLPGSKGQVLGASKLIRLVELLARRPVLQERMVNDVTEALMKVEGCLGAACISYGEHYCMKMRGVRQDNAVIVTSSLKGILLDNPEVREEFLSLAR